MRDRDIRKALRDRLVAAHAGEDDTKILDEVGLCAHTARVDLAVINGEVHGYEIKSERDTLARLKRQERVYSDALDRVTIVVGPSHEQEVLQRVPEWWGVVVALPSRRGVELVDRRPAAENPVREPYAIAQWLWRDEALALLEERGLARGLRTKPRRHLWARLAAALDPVDLAAAVRRKLKDRNWLAGGQRR